MGYDRTIAVFSPDGRLFQVEYAKEAVKRGATALGIVFKDGILLATVKPAAKLMVSLEKIFQIDDHIGAVASGLLADARILINQARIRAQVHRITYEEPIDVWNLARVIGDRMQLSTLYGRPKAVWGNHINSWFGQDWKAFNRIRSFWNAVRMESICNRERGESSE